MLFSQPFSKQILASACTLEGKFITVENALELLKRKSISSNMRVDNIRLSDMSGWSYNKDNGNIQHKTGKFFKIEGISVINSRSEKKIQFDQPIINQPEVGFLGCIAKEFFGTLYFLVQAKVEPGNINGAQFSPTLQATKSNFTRQHSGVEPPFLSNFLNIKTNSILIDQLQSEHGNRFYKKRNRNLIIISDNLDIDPESYIWLTLAQIKELCKHDNIVNMDLKSVIGSLYFYLYKQDINLFASIHSLDTKSFGYKLLRSTCIDSFKLNSNMKIYSWLNELKFNNNLITKKVPLLNMPNWKFNEYNISHLTKKYFTVSWISIQTQGREVFEWDQPIISSIHQGLNCFFVMMINGTYHFLAQAIMEFGLLDCYEIGPTIQAVPSDELKPLEDIPFYNYFSKQGPESVVFDSISSEEGGRFMHDCNRYIILEVPEDFILPIPSNYMWVSYSQLLGLVSQNNLVNVQARVLLAALSFCD